MNLTHFYRRNRTQYNTAAVGILATAVLTAVAWLASGWPPYPLWLAAASLTTAVAYALDKTRAAAGRTQQRLPESVLHFFSLMGGFVGAAFGLLVLRHKSNIGRHPLFPVFIIAGALLHATFFWLTR